jgi:hypothetical protein
MPLDFSGLCKQRFRWALGMMHIYRKHRKLLLGAGSGERKLTLMQRLSFWGLANQYLTELVPVLSLCLFSVGVLVHESMGNGPVVQACLYLPALTCLLYLWTTVARMLVATRHSPSLFPIAGAMAVTFSLSWVTAWACVWGFASRKVVFLRTPKTLDNLGWLNAVRSARLEAGFASLAILLTAWLFHNHFTLPAVAALFLGVVFGCAPLVSLGYIWHGAKSGAAEADGAAAQVRLDAAARNETKAVPFRDLQLSDMPEVSAVEIDTVP